MKVFEDYSLLKYNTFGIDVKCKRFIEYENLEELEHIQKELKEPYMCVGQGSNLLFTKDYEGTVLHCGIKGIKKISGINEDNSEKTSVLVQVGGGEIWDDVVGWCISNKYYGTENLSNIPGEMGAATVQNIGAYGVEVKDVIAWVDMLHLPSGTVRRMHVKECGYGYRTSKFKTDLKGQCAVYSVTLRLNKEFVPKLDYFKKLQDASCKLQDLTARKLRQLIIDTRNSKLPDPKEIGNAGSFFKNPIVKHTVFEQLISQYPNMPHYDQEGGVKIPAGWMIEQCGWKGKNLGNAGVYERQALVLVNNGGASGNDIVVLCKTIQKDVKEKFGIDIEPEVNII